jgi:hypothetical protein
MAGRAAADSSVASPELAVPAFGASWHMGVFEILLWCAVLGIPVIGLTSLVMIIILMVRRKKGD